MTNSSLLDVNDSVLIVIDIQPPVVKEENKSENNPLLQMMCWVIQVAKWLHVPFVVTAEDISNPGNISDEVAQLLPPDTMIYNKMTFGLASPADILEAVRNTNRKNCRTHRLRNGCVCHTFRIRSYEFGLPSRCGC